MNIRTTVWVIALGCLVALACYGMKMIHDLCEMACAVGKYGFGL